MKKINFLALALAAAAAPLLVVLSAKADLAQLNDGAPFVSIKSNGGQITVRPGEPDGLVRVPGNPAGVRMQRFYVNNSTAGHVTLPGPGCFGRFRKGCGGAVRQFNVPVRDGPHGVTIVNPGGELGVSVPNRVEAMFINAGASPVLMEQTRGPYLIIGENDITLRGVAGRGLARTTSGTVDVRNPAGGLRIETGSGHVIMHSNAALERGEVFTDSGDVEWTFSGIGGGPYRVNANAGLIKIAVRPGVAANIDAVSVGGTVVNYLDSAAAEVRLARPHALSLSLGGGGAQITVHSNNGTIVIVPAQ